MGLISLILEVLKKPSLLDVFFELMLLTVPLWIAVFVGVFLGWAWRPKWAVFNEEGESKLSNESSCSSANAKGLNSIHSLISFKSLFPSFLPGNVSVNLKDGNFIEQPCVLKSNFRLVKFVTFFYCVVLVECNFYVVVY